MRSGARPETLAREIASVLDPRPTADQTNIDVTKVLLCNMVNANGVTTGEAGGRGNKMLV